MPTAASVRTEDRCHEASSLIAVADANLDTPPPSPARGESSSLVSVRLSAFWGVEAVKLHSDGSGRA